MNRSKRTREIIIAALLIAISIIIPLAFGFLKVIIPPYTATLAAHVPQFIALLISPFVAVLVGVGSVIGFFVSGTPIVVVARASSHIVWALVGAYLIKKKMGYVQMTLITSIIHGVYEGIIIIPFIGGITTANQKLIIITIVGTILHHIVDAILALAIAYPLQKSLKKQLIHKLF